MVPPRREALLLLAALTACGSGAAIDDAGSAPDAAAADLSSDAETVRISIGPIPLAPGRERTFCSVLRLPTEAAIDVTRIDAVLAPGSHHLVFSRSSETIERTTPFECSPFELNTQRNMPLYIAETQNNNGLPLPSGVAYHFEAGQMVRLEAHYLNATPNPIEARGDIVLTIGRAASYELADIMFCGSIVQLYSNGIPPGESTLSAGFFRPPSGLRIFGLTTHQHRRGTKMVIDRSLSTAAGENLVTSTSWDNPTFRIYGDDDLLSLESGEGLRWQCSYNNPDNRTIYFGESAADNEMCFLWAYYYPSAGRFIAEECQR